MGQTPHTTPTIHPKKNPHKKHLQRQILQPPIRRNPDKRLHQNDQKHPNRHRTPTRPHNHRNQLEKVRTTPHLHRTHRPILQQPPRPTRIQIPKIPTHHTQLPLPPRMRPNKPLRHDTTLHPQTNKRILPTSNTNIRTRMHRIIPPLQRPPSQPLLRPQLQNTIRTPNNNENNKTNKSRRRNNLGLRNNRIRHEQLLIYLQLQLPELQRNNNRSKIQTPIPRLETSTTLKINRKKAEKTIINKKSAVNH